MNMSKLERLLEILRLMSEKQPSTSTAKNPLKVMCREYPELTGDIDFLVEQKMIKKKIAEKQTLYEMTTKGTKVLNYFDLKSQTVNCLYSEDAKPNDLIEDIVDPKPLAAIIKDDMEN